ncbi:MAG: enoyl-CoA hydratase/isomerase family protein [Pseudomonadota bacterium]
MMEFDGLKIAVSNGIARVVLSRPETLNRFDRTLMTSLRDAARALHDRADVNVVILSAEGDAFSAGADLGSTTGVAEDQTLIEQRLAFRLGPDMCEAWERLEQVTLIAIQGYCIGGAAALALACDFRIADKGASLRLPEVPLGINMSWRSVPRLATLIGPSKAKRFAMLGEAINAPLARDWGLVDEVVEIESAVNAAEVLAARLNALPPLALRMTKEAINAAANAGHYTSSFMDRDQFLLTFGSEDFKEGVSAFFEKREPTFRGT